jgi:hypothetical protein
MEQEKIDYRKRLLHTAILLIGKKLSSGLLTVSKDMNAMNFAPLYLYAILSPTEEEYSVSDYKGFIDLLTRSEDEQ